MFVEATGMVTGLGHTAEQTAAAVRCAITNFRATRFENDWGEPIIGSAVPGPLRGEDEFDLSLLLTTALDDCLSQRPDLDPASIPLLIAIAEPQRPGRPDDLDDMLSSAIRDHFGRAAFADIRMLSAGTVGGGVALHQARRLFAETDCRHVLVAGVDTMLDEQTLAWLDGAERLLTPDTIDGFIPGEGAGAVLLSRAPPSGSVALRCLGLGFGVEARAAEDPVLLRGEGLIEAMREAFAMSGIAPDLIDYRIADTNGDRYRYREAMLAAQRMLAGMPEPTLWGPGDCLGELGAASIPCFLGLALIAACHGYSRGPNLLCHGSNEDGRRFAAILQRVQGAIS